MHPCSDHYDTVDEEWVANEWDYNLERESERVLGPEGAAGVKDSGGARSVKDSAYYDLLKVWCARVCECLGTQPAVIESVHHTKERIDAGFLAWRSIRGLLKIRG